MQACKFTINTSVDEVESAVARVGTIQVEDGIFVLCYEEENARVIITLQKGVARIDRDGDYSLQMQLEEGKTTKSLLSIGGTQGGIVTKTHRVKYSQEGKVFKLSLRYDLIFSEDEVQKTKLNLKGQIKDR